LIVEDPFDEPLLDPRGLGSGAEHDGSGQIAAPRLRNKMQPQLFFRQQTTRLAMPFFSSPSSLSCGRSPVLGWSLGTRAGIGLAETR
jgi:hypothetical protein